MANKKPSKTQAPDTPPSANGLSRREFLTGVGTVAFSAALTALPQRADAFHNMTAFWKRNSAGGGSSSGNGSDPYWDYVTLLMQFDGTNGSTVFADESNVGKTPTILGSPYIDTSAGSSPYSGKVGSVVFNGSTDRISYADHADFEVTGDFTAEVWVKTTTVSATQLIFGKDPNSGSTWASYNFSITNSGTWRFSVSTNNSGQDLNTTFGSITANTWYHAAIVRSSGSWSVYINGTRLYGPTSTGNPYDGSGGFVIGQEINTAATSWLSGRMADLRIYKGLAKYTGNFTPRTTPQGLGSANDSNWGYCVLACPFENSFKDMSGGRFMTLSSAALSTSVKKHGTASLSLNGTSQALALANTTLNLGSSNFTIECFTYVSGTTGADQYIINTGAAGAGGVDNGYAVALLANLTGIFFQSGNATFSFTKTFAIGTWYHIAISRSGSSLFCYVDGTLVGTQSMTIAVNNAATTDYTGIGGLCGLGNNNGYPVRNWFSGYIDSLRITKGYARYVSSFTPPTAAFPVGKDESVDPFWTNTVLAMHMESVTDSTSRHSMTNNNSVGFNTTTYKYGTASASFNGSNTYVSTPSSSDFSMSTGDYTAECWVQFAVAPSGDIGIFQTETNLSASNNTLWMGYNSGKAWMGQHGTSNNVSGSWSPIAGVWYHFAASRHNGTGYVFINGVLLGSGSFNYTLTEAGAVAGKVTALNYLNGYIDDLRVTKGVARYVQSFTPPTQAFATTQYTTGSGSIVTSGLVCHLDAGDSSSYNGSSQTWSNLVASPADGSAKTAYDVYRGSSSSSDSTDPTFIGVANGLAANDYFSFDGSDCFTLAGSNTTFLDSLHKSGAAYTVIMVFYKVPPTQYDFLAGTCYYSQYAGVALAYNGSSATDNRETFDVFKAVTGQKALYKQVDTGLSTNAWHFLAWSIQENGGAVSFAYADGSYMPVGGSNLWSASYSSPSSSNTSAPFRIGARPDDGTSYPLSSGFRIAKAIVYNRALSKAELDQNWNATRARFGL